MKRRLLTLNEFVEHSSLPSPERKTTETVIILEFPSGKGNANFSKLSQALSLAFEDSGAYRIEQENYESKQVTRAILHIKNEVFSNSKLDGAVANLDFTPTVIGTKVFWNY